MPHTPHPAPQLSLWRMLAVAVVLLSSLPPVHAAETTAQQDPPTLPVAPDIDVDHSQYLSVQVENDVFTGTDRHYTNGVRMSWLSGEQQTPDWLLDAATQVPFFPAEGTRRWGMAVGHSLFTPTNTQQVSPSPGDRPYSGWLYGSVGLVSQSGNRLDNLELTLGMVGPSAHGETVQNNWHRLIGVKTAKGWDNFRLHDEPGFLLTYERKWTAWREIALPEDGSWLQGFGADLTPHMGATVGNVMTYGAVGGTLRVGFDLPQDFGPPRIRPSLPGTTFFAPGGTFGWYLFAGAEGRAVARNIFLDGNTFRDSPRVDKFPFVADFQAGAAVVLDPVRIAYTQIWRSREYRGQGEPDTFGALSLTLRF